MQKLKVAAPILRSLGFVALGIGGFYAFALTFAGGIDQSGRYWMLFVIGMLSMWFGDRIQKVTRPNSTNHPFARLMN